MLGTQHKPPRIPAGAQVEALRREDEKANRLTPTSLVTVINRGREALVRKWDAEDYTMRSYTHNGGTVDAPYLMQMPYGAALHFQHHCPIPGTRDPNSNTLAAESFLGILDTDPPEMCEPLTDEQCASFGQSIEAIERTAGEQTKVVDVKKNARTRAGIGGLGNQPRRPQTTTGEEADREADRIAREAMKSPDGVSDEIRADAEEGERELEAAKPRSRRGR